MGGTPILHFKLKNTHTRTLCNNQNLKKMVDWWVGEVQGPYHCEFILVIEEAISSSSSTTNTVISLECLI